MRSTFIGLVGAAVCGLLYALWRLSGRPRWYQMYPESFNR